MEPVHLSSDPSDPSTTASAAVGNVPTTVYIGVPGSGGNGAEGDANNRASGGGGESGSPHGSGGGCDYSEGPLDPDQQHKHLLQQQQQQLIVSNASIRQHLSLTIEQQQQQQQQQHSEALAMYEYEPGHLKVETSDYHTMTGFSGYAMHHQVPFLQTDQGFAYAVRVENLADGLERELKGQWAKCLYSVFLYNAWAIVIYSQIERKV